MTQQQEEPERRGLRRRRGRNRDPNDGSDVNQRQPRESDRASKDRSEPAPVGSRGDFCENEKREQDLLVARRGEDRSAAAQRRMAQEEPCTFRVAKWAILRLLGLVYLFAFLGAHFQNDGLMGRHGLVPAPDDLILFVERVPAPDLASRGAQSVREFLRHPTVFWFVPLRDEHLARLYELGIVLSGLALAGVNSWLLQFLLWLSYLSIVTMAQLLAQSSSGSMSFYSYGWESQLLETGFLAIFLCQLPNLVVSSPTRRWRIDLALCESYYNAPSPPSPVVRWLFGWLMFRISVGAGLIKVRGSSCWTHKTCLHYHFETQPIPSPLSFAFHFLSPSMQKRMVDVDLWVQLYTSFLVLIPVEVVPSTRIYARRLATALLRLGGVLQVGFMVGILLSGNFAFLNHLTIIPGLACFDDGFVPKVLLDHVVTKQQKPGARQEFGDTVASAPPPSPRHWFRPSRTWVDAALLAWIAVLSGPVVANLLQLKGSRQVMNASFDPFHIVNTYGAFGSVGESRYEAIVQVHNGTDWVEIELPCKPGNVRRRPCFCAPYHYRLDWNIWFLGFKPHQGMLRQRESWMFSLLVKLLSSGSQPRPWLDLLDSQSSAFLTTHFFDHGSAPLKAKVDMYHYKMNKSLGGLLRDFWNGEEVVWWRRRFEESLIPPVMLDATGIRLQLAPTD